MSSFHRRSTALDYWGGGQVLEADLQPAGASFCWSGFCHIRRQTYTETEKQIMFEFLDMKRRLTYDLKLTFVSSYSIIINVFLSSYLNQIFYTLDSCIYCISKKSTRKKLQKLSLSYILIIFPTLQHGFEHHRTKMTFVHLEFSKKKNSYYSVSRDILQENEILLEIQIPYV